MFEQTTRQMLDFIEKSPSCFHVVKNVADMLEAAGFIRLSEEDRWDIRKGGKYFTTRNGSSLIAFTIPADGGNGCRIIASHSDSPCFKIKENPEIAVENCYVKLNVEKYGGMLCAPWFDRPLSVAGRVVVKEDGRLTAKPVNVDRDLFVIPSLAIHMNREANNGQQYNVQKDLLPLYGDFSAKDTFMTLIADTAGVGKEDILAHDLYLYNRVRGCIWGADNAFVSSARLDDLQCAFSTLQGFLQGAKEKYAAVYCVLDNEEVGSETRQGAASAFLYDTWMRVNESLGGSYEDYVRSLSKSFLISADNAHAVHPNAADKADPVNRPQMNGGIVIKYSANQKYCTDAMSAAFLKDLCRKAEVPYQTFTNRSDMQGGSTLGNIATTKVTVRAADIGLAQLAMHSPYETAGVKDAYYMVKAAKTYYE